jgi:hypothetical protein
VAWVHGLPSGWAGLSRGKSDSPHSMATILFDGCVPQQGMASLVSTTYLRPSVLLEAFGPGVKAVGSRLAPAALAPAPGSGGGSSSVAAAAGDNSGAAAAAAVSAAQQRLLLELSRLLSQRALPVAARCAVLEAVAGLGLAGFPLPLPEQVVGGRVVSESMGGQVSKHIGQ